VIKVDLREAIMHFSKYMKLVRQGEAVVVMERGAPIAVIKPLARVMGPEQRIRLLEEQGVLKRPSRSAIPSGSPINLCYRISYR
jgi:prevent-host-death family protein